ncbi:hypothetical protein AMATHDRAFT_54368 [Amanita thiersii Skay4041]|uniref:Uncharacterized protein n=1 Tax=Amanita thiersii Skay4041 TaxID=703135 RepID=A0A2A9P0A0_9AGAR|nr:hypothetical protein AMATHDRAFT_54368 [Amanita thiersii Skay4041]
MSCDMSDHNPFLSSQSSQHTFVLNNVPPVTPSTNRFRNPLSFTPSTSSSRRHLGFGTPETRDFSLSQSSPQALRVSDDDQYSADAIEGILQHLVGGLPDYLRKLERQVIASTQSSHAKTMRIQELEQQVVELQRQKMNLEKALADLGG